MMASDLPPGRRLMDELREHIADLVAELAELQDALPSVNEPDLHERVLRLTVIGPHLAHAHGSAPGPDIADVLTVLLDGARRLNVPARDRDLGATPTLTSLRKAKGLIIAAADDALKAAAALGWHPAQEPFPREQGLAISRQTYANQLHSMEERLGDVARKLDTLERIKERLEAEQTTFVQQNGLLNLYIGAMRVEVDLARLQLTVGDTTVDLNVLARTTQAMGGLTRDFIATVRGWAARVAPEVTQGAEAVRGSVRRLTTRVRAFVRALWWEAKRTEAAAAAAAVTAHAPGTIHRDGPDYPEMVLIPAGRFQMGVPEEESWREESDDDDARPVHTVTFARPFWLGRFPVTRGEYAAFVADTGYDKDGGKWSAPGFRQTDRHPVVNVSARDAEEYAAWLSRKTGYLYRLPSEAEWEYAARAGTVTARFWGGAWEGHEPYAHAGSGTAPVDGRQPNQFGMHDMLGNVWEWCADHWHDNYKGAPSDGAVWITDHNEIRRVLRGGSWDYVPGLVRAGIRVGYGAGDRDNDAGFRLARTL